MATDVPTRSESRNARLLDLRVKAEAGGYDRMLAIIDAELAKEE